MNLSFFLVSLFLLQVLSRSFSPLPPFLDFSSFFLTLVEGYFLLCQGLLLMPVFSTGVHFAKECQIVVPPIAVLLNQFLSTNPLCGLLHSLCQGISRFPQIGVVFLTFKKFVPLNVDGGSVNALLAAALTRVMRGTVPIPALTTISFPKKLSSGSDKK